MIVIMLATFSVACATSNTQILSTRSYDLGVVQSATIGNPMLVDQIGSVTKRKEWVGIAFSKDGWKHTEEYSSDFLRKELIYSGKSGSVIEIAYREFRGVLAAPAFYQNVKYDLAESNTISFQKYKMQVIDASNQSISYKVLSD
jgi:hypothetical protein